MNRKIKMIIFILLIISFVIVFFFGIFGTSLSFLSSKEIKETRKLNKDLITTLKINNIDSIYDKNNNIYYYMVSEEFENNMYVLNLEVDKGLRYKIVGETLNVINVDYDKQIKVIIYNDEYYYETKIQLTNLPLINIITEDEITSNETETIFTYINCNKTEKVITNNSLMHIRGASSLKFDKKNYKINFVNKNYNNDKKIYISDFYYGDSLILDAIYRDPSKIRNVLATQLWNDISNDFTDQDMYSEFVEVFINNEYIGLYVLSEPVNRSNLNLNKSSNDDTSIVIKTQDWFTVKSNMNFKDINSDSYLSYELKYPNDENLYSISWNKILSKLANYYDLSENSSYEIIKSTWNMENYIDIIIFSAFTNNLDNQLMKNNYFYMKSLEDNEVYMQPWDMEYSFGLEYDRYAERSVLKNIEDYDKIYTIFKHSSPEINKLLIERYWQLRKSVLTKEYFNNLLDTYKNELNRGATLRDSNICYEYDVEEEIEEIRIWIYNRLEYFDEYIKDLENE